MWYYRFIQILSIFLYFLSVKSAVVFRHVSRRDLLLQVLLRPRPVVCYKAKDFLRTALQWYKQEINWKQGRSCGTDTNMYNVQAVMSSALFDFLCCQWLGVTFRTRRCQVGYWIRQILALATRTFSRNTAKRPVQQQPLALRR